MPSGRCCDVCDPDGALEQAVIATTAPRRASTRSRSAGQRVDEQDFEKLRAWRWERAEGKPAFTVAGNAVLEEVLFTRPGSIEELIEIRGIGPAFCEKHGESLLAELSRLGASTTAVANGRAALASGAPPT